MQISRHWRNQQLRYRLEGIRFQNGEVSLQARQLHHPEGEPRSGNVETPDTVDQDLKNLAVALYNSAS